MKALKYFSVLILPLVVYISFNSRGWLTHLPSFIFFGLVPFLEFFIKPNLKNFNKEEEMKSILDGVFEEANIEAQSYSPNELESYKDELIEKARQAGWYIELSDDLEVIKQEKIN